MPTRAASRRLKERGTKRETGADIVLGQQEATDHRNKDGFPPAEDQGQPSAAVSENPSPVPVSSFTPVNFTEQPITDEATHASSERSVSQHTPSAAEPPKRFKTRAGITRKTQAEREELRKAEEARRQERLANLPAGSETQPVSRERGTLRGNNAPQRIRNQQAIGPLGSDLSSSRKERGRRTANAEETEVINPQPPSPMAQEPDHQISKAGPSERKTKGKGRAQPSTQTDEPLYVSSADENDGHKRRDIEDIEKVVISSDEDAGIIQSGKGRSRPHRSRSRIGIGLRPIRADKEEHITRPIGIAATAKRFKADVKQVKLEKDGDEAVLEVPVANEDPGQAVDGGKPVSIEDEVHTDELVLAEPVHTSRDERARGRKTRKSSFRDARQATETLEERLERERLDLDLLKMREIWDENVSSVPLPEMPPISQDTDTGPPFASRNGQVFLMQFPPLTPMLVDPMKEIERASQPDSLGNSGQADAKPVIKKEGGQSGFHAALSPDTRMMTAANGQLPPGLVGKLKVHRSGKVTMDWGGADMIVRWGTEVNFLQDLVLTGPAGESIDAQAYALAQVKEKLVVTPDWQKIYD